jgi:hypothetical protein
MGTFNGREYFNPDGQPDDPRASSVFWDGTAWSVTFSDESAAYSNGGEDVPNPWESAEWNPVDGAEPVPTVTQA